METRLTYTLRDITISVGDLIPIQGGVIITKIVRYPFHNRWSVEYTLLQEDFSWSRKAHQFVKYLHTLSTNGLWSPAT
jgi:hypothetical protein